MNVEGGATASPRPDPSVRTSRDSGPHPQLTPVVKLSAAELGKLTELFESLTLPTRQRKVVRGASTSLGLHRVGGTSDLAIDTLDGSASQLLTYLNGLTRKCADRLGRVPVTSWAVNYNTWSSKHRDQGWSYYISTADYTGGELITEDDVLIDARGLMGLFDGARQHANNPKLTGVRITFVGFAHHLLGQADDTLRAGLRSLGFPILVDDFDSAPAGGPSAAR